MAVITDQDLKRAVQLAQQGDWERSHLIAQESGAPVACWLHAVLHKMEPDPANSRYWYARSGGRRYEDYADARQELQAIAAELDGKVPN